ncbi:MAG TPA: SusC/RagA family TonB-linked outer membrane protein [Puia sp.]|nr:SusC/RagA family TonB-linked outer membrane protein [Puia sp.]
MRTLLYLLLCLISLSARAQNEEVSGRVSGVNGEPVSFATVSVKGTKNTVAADANGTFRIRASVGQTLIVSAANYATQEVVINQLLDIGIILQPGQSAMNEVVVVALGQSRAKAKLGYSTATFNSDAITKVAPVGMLDGLQGKVAGADISTVGGTPGSSVKVVLRGFGVIGGGNNQPLYVIDGIPLSDASIDIGTAGGNGPALTDYGNGMNDVNPNDIESITILKGTSASSLYGSVAKNGAILITTKRGKAGKLKVDLNSAFNVSMVGKLPDEQTEFGQGWSGVFDLGQNGSWGPKLDGQMRPWGAIVDNSQLVKPFAYQKNSIRDFYDRGTEFNNTLSVSGGNDRTNFYFSYGNITSDGILPSDLDKLQRNNLSLRLNTSYNNLSVSTSINYINRYLTTPAKFSLAGLGNDLFNNLLQIPVDMRIEDFRDYQNKFFNVDNYFTPFAENPYYDLFENGSNSKSDRVFGKVDMTYKFSNAWSAQFRIGGDFSNARTRIWNAVNAPSPGSWNSGNNVDGSARQPDLGSYQEQSDYNSLINADLIAKYSKEFGTDFTLDVIAGANFYQTQASNVTSAIQGLTIPHFYNLSNSNSPPTGSNNSFEKRLIGIYAQATVGWKEQLFLTVNARNDWSSTLPLDNNNFFYPGANLSWLASRTFALDERVISLLKFRLAYGQTGADAQPYLIYPTIQQGNIPSTSGIPYGSVTFPIAGVNGFTITPSIGNTHLQPILTKETELGVEARFLDNRIGIDADVYDKETDGEIFNVPIAPSSGYSGLIENVGLVSNKGIEITLNVNPVRTKDFNWNFNYTFAKNESEVVRLANGLDKIQEGNDGLTGGMEFDLFPGKPVGIFLSPYPKYTADGKMVVDANTGFPVQADEKQDIGTSQRDFSMGLVNAFSYKNWALSFSLDWRMGGKFYSSTADITMFAGNAAVTAYNDRKPFIIPNSVNEAPGSTPDKPVYVENKTVIDETVFDSYFYTNNNKPIAYPMRLIDKSFLKLRDISIAYTLPKKWASDIHSSNLMLSLYGRNFILWLPKQNRYIDPEVSNLGNDLQSEFGEYSPTGPTTVQFGVALRASF